MRHAETTSLPDWWDDMRGKFFDSCENRFSAMILAVHHLSNEPSAGESLERLSTLFHDLAGLGGSFGAPALTSLARNAESICREVVLEGRTISSRELLALIDAIDQMRTESERAQSGSFEMNEVLAADGQTSP